MSLGYKKLDVWNEAYKLSLRIYEITKNYPKEETFALVSQMRRASVSIIANIAEGYSKGYLKDYIRYVSISIGSYNELEVFLLLSYDLNYLTKKNYDELYSKHDKIGKMLFGLRKGLKRRLNEISHTSQASSSNSNKSDIKNRI